MFKLKRIKNIESAIKTILMVQIYIFHQVESLKSSINSVIADVDILKRCEGLQNELNASFDESIQELWAEIKKLKENKTKKK